MYYHPHSISWLIQLSPGIVVSLSVETMPPCRRCFFLFNYIYFRNPFVTTSKVQQNYWCLFLNVISISDVRISKSPGASAAFVLDSPCWVSLQLSAAFQRQKRWYDAYFLLYCLTSKKKTVLHFSLSLKRQKRCASSFVPLTYLASMNAVFRIIIVNRYHQLNFLTCLMWLTFLRHFWYF